MIRIVSIALLSFAVVSFVIPDLQAQANQYTIEQTINAGYNPWIKGQTFTPSIGIDPDPGSVSTLDLKSITFYASNQGWSGSTSHFYLNIYDGDPVNGNGAFVGSSIYTVDVSQVSNFDPLTWTFHNLTLDYTHEYWALVSSTNTDGGFDVYCGMRESGQTDPYVGGTSIAGITNDPWGYHVKPTIDLAFEIMLQGDLTDPEIDIKANESDGPININQGSNLTIDIFIDPGPGLGDNADWWLLATSPFGWYNYSLGIGNWAPGFMVTYMGPLSKIGPFTAFDASTLPVGFYTFFFGVDMNMNGSLDMSVMFFDSVDVGVQ